jgi:hypothetical protein
VSVRNLGTFLLRNAAAHIRRLRNAIFLVDESLAGTEFKSQVQNSHMGHGATVHGASWIVIDPSKSSKSSVTFQ